MLKKLLLLSLLFTVPINLKSQDTSTSQIRAQKGSVVHISSVQQFDALLTEHSRVVVDFYAPWCGPCKRMSPMIDQLAREFNDILFVKINIDTVKQLANRYSVMSIPTFMFFRNGNRVHRFTGMRSKSAMAKEIRSRLG